jgi:hypothetical protein
MEEKRNHRLQITVYQKRGDYMLREIMYIVQMVFQDCIFSMYLCQPRSYIPAHTILPVSVMMYMFPAIMLMWQPVLKD